MARKEKKRGAEVILREAIAEHDEEFRNREQKFSILRERCTAQEEEIERLKGIPKSVDTIVLEIEKLKVATSVDCMKSFEDKLQIEADAIQTSLDIMNDQLAELNAEAKLMDARILELNRDYLEQRMEFVKLHEDYTNYVPAANKKKSKKKTKSQRGNDQPGNDSDRRDSSTVSESSIRQSSVEDSLLPEQLLNSFTSLFIHGYDYLKVVGEDTGSSPDADELSENQSSQGILNGSTSSHTQAEDAMVSEGGAEGSIFGAITVSIEALKNHDYESDLRQVVTSLPGGSTLFGYSSEQKCSTESVDH